jgi:negative regulator of sigma E activity
MNQQDIREQLSALIDGELERDSARFLLRRIGHDEELGARWERWHRYGEALRGAAQPLREDFAARIMAAIENDEVQAAVEQPREHRVLRWGGGFAVAASVAFAALLLVRPAGNGETPMVPGEGIASEMPAMPVVEDAVVAPSPYREQDLRLPQRFNTQTVSALDNSGYGLKFGFDPNAEAYRLRHQQVTNNAAYGVQSVTPQAWSVPLRAPEQAQPAAR